MWTVVKFFAPHPHLLTSQERKAVDSEKNHMYKGLDTGHGGLPDPRVLFPGSRDGSWREGQAEDNLVSGSDQENSLIPAGKHSAHP